MFYYFFICIFYISSFLFSFILKYQKKDVFTFFVIPLFANGAAYYVEPYVPIRVWLKRTFDRCNIVKYFYELFSNVLFFCFLLEVVLLDLTAESVKNGFSFYLYHSIKHQDLCHRLNQSQKLQQTLHSQKHFAAAELASKLCLIYSGYIF